mgnify:CR=1 FL=1
MNFLSLFVLIPLLMLGGLYLAKSIKAIRGVMVAGSTALLILSVVLTFLYLGERRQELQRDVVPCRYGMVCTASHSLLGGSRRNIGSDAAA